MACLFAYCSSRRSRLALIGGKRWGNGGGSKLERGCLGKGWGSTNYLVVHRVCVVGCNSLCCFCPSHRACLVSNPVPTFAVAAEMCPVVMVFFCAVPARQCLSAHHCKMAIGPALVALGHDVLNMEDFAIFGLMLGMSPSRIRVLASSGVPMLINSSP